MRSPSTTTRSKGAHRPTTSACGPPGNSTTVVAGSKSGSCKASRQAGRQERQTLDGHASSASRLGGKARLVSASVIVRGALQLDPACLQGEDILPLLRAQVPVELCIGPCKQRSMQRCAAGVALAVLYNIKLRRCAGSSAQVRAQQKWAHMHGQQATAAALTSRVATTRLHALGADITLQGSRNCGGGGSSSTNTQSSQ